METTPVFATEFLETIARQLEAQLQAVLDTPSVGGWSVDAQCLQQRLNKYRSEWFTFLRHPKVKPDNNDAKTALRPVVVHRKVSGGARSNWGKHLVVKMFSFLETVRLQGSNAAAKLFELLATETVEVLPVCSLPEISRLVREPSSQQALLLAVSSYNLKPLERTTYV